MQFVYDSEHPNVYNQLLSQIQKGVRLKRTKCNDRSRPNLDGLYHFTKEILEHAVSDKCMNHTVVLFAR